MAARRPGPWQGLLFICVASLVGEATEISRFMLGGMAVPSRLATTLIAAHVVLAIIALALGRLLARGSPTSCWQLSPSPWAACWQEAAVP
jgi:hypothetical protein